jgi:hypothetical protein
MQEFFEKQTMESIKEILSGNDCFVDRGHLKIFVEQHMRNKDPNAVFFSQTAFDNFFTIPKNNEELNKKIAKYKELLEKSKNQLDEIISTINVCDYCRKEIKEILANALCHFFKIKEKILPTKNMSQLGQYHYLVLSTRHLAEEILCNDKAVLKVVAKIFPLENEIKDDAAAYIKELPYILHGISMECGERKLSSYKNISDLIAIKKACERIENAIRDGELIHSGCYQSNKDYGRVEYKNLALWLHKKYEENQNFCVPFPNWLKAKMEKELDCNAINGLTMKRKCSNLLKFNENDIKRLLENFEEKEIYINIIENP